MNLIALALACHAPEEKPPRTEPEPSDSSVEPTTPPPTGPHAVVVQVTDETPVVRVRALGDTDGDGRDEVLAVTVDGVALVVGAAGTLARIAGVEHAAPGGDADGDGLADLALIADGSWRMGFAAAPFSGERFADSVIGLPLDPPVDDLGFPYFVHPAADAMADLDGDGRSDFVALAQESYDFVFSLLIGATQVDLPLAVDTSGGLALLGPDAVAFTVEGGAVEVYDPAIASSASLSGLPRSTRVPDGTLRALGDVDGDGEPDVAGTSSQGRAVGMGVLLTSAPAVSLPGLASEGADVAGDFDLNGDGATDVALTWFAGAGRHVAIGLGPWAALADLDLEARLAEPSALTGPVAAADLDGDGVPDLALGTSDGLVVVSGASVLAEPSDAALPPPHEPLDGCAVAPIEPRTLSAVGTPPLDGALSAAEAPVEIVNDDGAITALAVGDVDGDGAPDLLVGSSGWLGYDNETSGMVAAVRAPRLGLSSLTEAQRVPGQGPSSGFGAALIAGDIDGDGDDDVFTGDWLLSSGPDGMGCPAEGAAYEGWQPRGAFLPDASGDGILDLAVVYDADPLDRVARVVEVRASPDPLGSSPRLVLTETGNDFELGTLLAAVADWDGDGRVDLALQADHDWLSDAWVSVVDASDAGTVPVADAAHATFAHNGAVTALASADVDGDGYSDLLVGVDEPLAPVRSEGAVYLLPGGLSGASPLASAAVGAIRGTEDFQRLGTDLAIGDTRGDGGLDLLVNQGSDSRAWLFGELGPGSRDTTDADVRFESAAGTTLGGQVELADLDGDGAQDVVLTAVIPVPFRPGVGEVLVFFGGAR